MQKSEDILECMLRLPDGFPCYQILDALIKEGADETFACYIEAQDADFMWLYFWWWLGKKETISYEQNRQYVRTLLHCDWIDLSLRLALTAELALDSLLRVPQKAMLQEDLIWYSQAKMGFELGARTWQCEEYTFYVNLCYAVAVLCRTEVLSEAVSDLPPGFLSQLFRCFLNWVEEKHYFLHQEAIAINFSYLIHAWYLKQMMECDQIDVTEVYRQALVAKDYLPIRAFQPGLLLLGAHYHLHGEYDLKLAVQFFSTIMRTRGSDKNYSLLSCFGRYAMQDFVLKAVRSMAPKRIMQAWLLVQKVPMVCAHLEFEVWFRYADVFLRAGHGQKALEVLSQIVALAESIRQYDYAGYARACAEGGELDTCLPGAVKIAAIERERCPCIKRYAASGFRLFSVVEEREPLNELADLVEHIRQSGIDVEITQVSEDELLDLAQVGTFRE